MIFLVGNNGATEAMRILNSGNVGIGTSPVAKLNVVDTSDTWVLGGYSAARALGNGVRFRAYDSAPQFIGEIRFASDNGANNASTATISVGNGAGGTLTALTIATTGGVQIGSPTGGDKGAGTANFAADIYKNNSAYNNPHGGFEFAYTGRLDRYADRMAAMGIQGYHGWTLADLEAYTREHYHFPYLGDDAGNGLFDGSDRLLLNVENIAVGVFDLARRLNDLEQRIRGTA